MDAAKDRLLHDIRDAIEHASDLYGPMRAIQVSPVRELPMDRLQNYDDLSPWLEFDRGELRNETPAERHRLLNSYRGSAWSRRAEEWIRVGHIPPIIIIQSGREWSVIGDGRGRTNLAWAMGWKKVPVVFVRTAPTETGRSAGKFKKLASGSRPPHGLLAARGVPARRVIAGRYGRSGGAIEVPVLYHLTDRAKFRLNPSFSPADNAIAIEDRSGRPGVYLSPDVERWVNGHGYWRPFVVEIQMDPSAVRDPGVHGRYGGEIFIPATSFNKLKVLRVIPLDAYAREKFGEPGWVEQSFGAEFDTGHPIPRVGSPHWADAWKKYRNYRYTGPDVRQMSSADVARLKKQLRHFVVRNRT